MEQKNTNQNLNIGNTFIGPTQMFGSVVLNSLDDKFSNDNATYKTEPLWRSQITLAVLNWVSFFIALVGIFPIENIINSLGKFFDGTFQGNIIYELQKWILFFLVVVILLCILMRLRKIAKKQIRYPLFGNLAISGFGNRIIIEKIDISKCPRCGGKMRFYNKPQKILYYDNNGNVREIIEKRVPVFECRRNPEHFYFVDIAEDKIE